MPASLAIGNICLSFDQVRYTEDNWEFFEFYSCSAKYAIPFPTADETIRNVRFNDGINRSALFTLKLEPDLDKTPQWVTPDRESFSMAVPLPVKFVLGAQFGIETNKQGVKGRIFVQLETVEEYKYAPTRIAVMM
jgi:hypothetical protein